MIASFLSKNNFVSDLALSMEANSFFMSGEVLSMMADFCYSEFLFLNVKLCSSLSFA